MSAAQPTMLVPTTVMSSTATHALRLIRFRMPSPRSIIAPRLERVTASRLLIRAARLRIVADEQPDPGRINGAPPGSLSDALDETNPVREDTHECGSLIRGDDRCCIPAREAAAVSGAQVGAARTRAPPPDG